MSDDVDAPRRLEGVPFTNDATAHFYNDASPWPGAESSAPNIPTIKPATQTGWVCPKCGKVNAPFMPVCVYEAQHETPTATGDATNPTAVCHECHGTGYVSESWKGRYGSYGGARLKPCPNGCPPTTLLYSHYVKQS